MKHLLLSYVFPPYGLIYSIRNLKNNLATAKLSLLVTLILPFQITIGRFLSNLLSNYTDPTVKNLILTTFLNVPYVLNYLIGLLTLLLIYRKKNQHASWIRIKQPI